MANSLGSKVTFLYIALALGFAAAPCFSQILARTSSLPKGAPSTVSVASMLIPQKAWQHLGKANNAALANQRADCEHEIDKALEAAPRFAQAYLLRASLRLRDGLYQEVVNNALSAQKIDPQIVGAATLIAGAESSLHRYHDALLVLDAIRGAEAESWQVAFERTRAYTGLADAEGALHWSAVAMRLAPQNRLDTHLLRADALNLAHRANEAIAQLEFYLASPEPQPQRADVLNVLAATRKQAEQESLAMVASR